jgi:hypothetical protein
MRISRVLGAAVITLAVCCVAVAQGPRSVLGYVDSTSFWVDTPDGWQADQATAKRVGAIFILLPADVALGPHVLVLAYTAQTELQYQAGLSAFPALLKTYAVGPKVVTPQ